VLLESTENGKILLEAAEGRALRELLRKLLEKIERSLNKLLSENRKVSSLQKMHSMFETHGDRRNIDGKVGPGINFLTSSFVFGT
jgi:hypothetical protein